MFLQGSARNQQGFSSILSGYLSEFCSILLACEICTDFVEVCKYKKEGKVSILSWLFGRHRSEDDFAAQCAAQDVPLMGTCIDVANDELVERVIERCMSSSELIQIALDQSAQSQILTRKGQNGKRV